MQATTKDNLRRFLLGVLTVLVSASAGAAMMAQRSAIYLAGFRQDRAAQLASVRADRHAAQTERDEAVAARDQARRERSLLASRIHLVLALEDLDRRNFGLVQDHVSRGADELTLWCAGQSPCGLQGVARGLGSFEISVAMDLEPQRRRLLDLAESIDTEALLE